MLRFAVAGNGLQGRAVVAVQNLLGGIEGVIDLGGGHKALVHADDIRSLAKADAGLLPVIALTSREKPWLTALLRHHRIGASVRKPVTSDVLHEAFRQIGELHGRHNLSSR